ncbi:MAG: helix-turn-helix domain-containing protein [Thermodesulfovibrionales bacterium]|nr:helix-turn-helix domain-containing protein [Thermodesulfovibrionales bacterium]
MRAVHIIFRLRVKNQRNLIGRLIKKYRQQKGLSQMALAEKIGVSYQQIQKYESGKNSITAERLIAISEALGIPVHKFFPSEKEVLSEEESPYGVLSEEEIKLIEHFRNIKDRNKRKAIFTILEAIKD